MQSLNSNNYEAVLVFIRGEDEPYEMKGGTGQQLMDYLVTQHNSSHVGITTITGQKIVVRTTDILKLVPVPESKKMEDYI